MKTDKNTTLQELRDYMAAYHHARGWDECHTAKNLAVSVAIEAAELMEHFQWEDDVRDKEEVADEFADILSYMLTLAEVLDIDIATAFRNKMAKCEKKYPVELFNPETKNLDAYHAIKKSYRSAKK